MTSAGLVTNMVTGKNYKHIHTSDKERVVGSGLEKMDA
jgi:hypothetical protein